MSHVNKKTRTSRQRVTDHFPVTHVELEDWRRLRCSSSRLSIEIDQIETLRLLFLSDLSLSSCLELEQKMEYHQIQHLRRAWWPP